MKNMAFTTTFLATLATLAACASFQAPEPGASTAAVEARLGQPTGVYRNGEDTMLEYAKGPAGQFTFMARMGPDGKLKSFEQVLTAEKLATIQLRKDTKDSVLRTFGRPTERLHYYSVDGDVWAYRYKEQLAWNSMMYVEFDRQGVVQALVNGPDPDYEERRGR